MDIEKTNVLGDNAVNGRDSGTVETTLSAGEFQRLQEQLLELRNRNYELIEENKRQQNYINVLPSKSNDTLNFASKVLHYHCSYCDFILGDLMQYERMALL